MGVGWGAFVAWAAAGGCHKPAPEASVDPVEPVEPVEAVAPVEAVEPVEAPAPGPDAELDAVVRALSVRDGEPDCAAVVAGLERAAAGLLMVVEQVSMPPTAPMRAAGCLLVHHADDPAVQAAVLEWVVQADTRGLALLVGQRLDSLPLPLAVAAATAGAAGPHAADLAPAIAGSARSEVRAVLATPARSDGVPGSP
jgi:hypothetical protein